MQKGHHSGTTFIRLFGLWLILYSTWGVAIEAPPMPFVAEGECVGENCTYRTEFIALVDTVARINHRDESLVAFQIRKGQRFYGIGSAVITNHPGKKAAIRVPFSGEVAFQGTPDLPYDGSKNQWQGIPLSR